MASFRKERMSDLLLSFVAGELRRLGDIRLDLVTITAVDMTPDLKTAWVYWTLADVAQNAAAPTAGATLADVSGADVSGADVSGVAKTTGAAPAPGGQTPGAAVSESLPNFPSEQRVAEADAALRGVVKLLKRRAGEELQLRYTPDLRFKFDSSSHYASRIEFLLKKAGY